MQRNRCHPPTTIFVFIAINLIKLNFIFNSKKIAPIKEIEERYDRAQQRKELAELSKGCHVARKKRAGPASKKILPIPSKLRAPEL